MSNMYRNYRRQAEKTVEGAAEELNVSPRTLYRYESGEIAPPPSIVYKMTVIYQNLSLIRRYCAGVCQAGQKINPPVLDNIHSSPLARFFKYYEELEEAVPQVKELIKIIIDRGPVPDMNDKEMAKIESLAEQILTDVTQALAEAWDAYSEIFGVEAVEKAWKRHRRKMLDRGYMKRIHSSDSIGESRTIYGIKEKTPISTGTGLPQQRMHF